MDVKNMLEAVRDGKLSVAQAESLLATLPYEDLGFAKIDRHRRLRTGYGEVIFGSGKTYEQLKEIFATFVKREEALLATRVNRAVAERLAHDFNLLEWDDVAGTLIFQPGTSAAKEDARTTASAAGGDGRRWPADTPADLVGEIAICTAGTSDLPVCREALQVAGFFGNRVVLYQDIGIAGIHRLFSQLTAIRKANVIIAIAGMEGALPSVLAGLVDVPVIAVPTSVGYGASFDGLAPLLTMLNSCAAGVAVVNIDNGFGAAYLASQINKLAELKKD